MKKLPASQVAALRALAASDSPLTEHKLRRAGVSMQSVRVLERADLVVCIGGLYQLTPTGQLAARANGAAPPPTAVTP